jgi:hypothetical protein
MTYVGDDRVLSHAILHVAFHELAVPEAILRTFWPSYTSEITKLAPVMILHQFAATGQPDPPPAQ